MTHELPGLDNRRLVRLMQAAIDRCALDLSGYVVLTEAASGAYRITPVLAAMAGAKQVHAITRDTRYGTVQAIAACTRELARLAGVEDRIEVIQHKRPELVVQADIVTNSGHVRPIDTQTVGWMKRTAVVPLMYEAWELRGGDVDLEACRERGVRVTGTNERHPAVDVFSFLGVMAVKLLLDAGVSVFRSRVMLMCDNDFGPFMERGLSNAGAEVDRVSAFASAGQGSGYDAVLVAMTPTERNVLSAAEMRAIGERWPGAVVAIFWGDVDRAELTAAGLGFWPREAPHRGHMGILPSDVGPESIVRLQAGSLKAAEALLRHAKSPGHPAHEYGQPLELHMERGV